MAGLSEIYLPKHSLSEMMRSCQSKMSALTYNRGHWVLLQLSHPLQLYKITAVPHLSHSLQLYKGRSPSNGKLSDISFYIDSQISAHRKFKK